MDPKTHVAPKLNIDIPTVQFTDSITGDELPFVGEYINGMLDFGIGFLVIIAMVVLIGSGIVYALSAGNQSRVAKALEMIHYSLVGVAIALGSYTILYIIDPDLTTFEALNIAQVARVEFEQFDHFTFHDDAVDQGSPLTAEEKANNPEKTDVATGLGAGEVISLSGKTIEAWVLSSGKLRPKPLIGQIPDEIPKTLVAGEATPGYTSVSSFNNAIGAIAHNFGQEKVSEQQHFCDLKSSYKSTAHAYGSKKYFGSLDCAGNYGTRNSIQHVILHTAGASVRTVIKNWRLASLGTYKADTGTVACTAEERKTDKACKRKKVVCDPIADDECTSKSKRPKKIVYQKKVKTGTYTFKRKPLASHFFIEQNGSAYQLADTKLNLRHCCSKNKTSVGIDLRPHIYTIKDGEKKGKQFWWYTQKQYDNVKNIVAAVGVPMTGSTIIAHCSQGNHSDPPFFSWGELGIAMGGNQRCSWTASRVGIAKAAREELGNAKFEQMCPGCSLLLGGEMASEQLPVATIANSTTP